MRNQSWMLAAAGLDSVLGKINTTKVLQNLRTSQEKGGDNRGCFWWRWNDRRIIDKNSGFFVTLGLLTLAHTGEGQLNQEQRELLDELLSEARYWFDGETRNLALRYPNKCLGDVVCMWLIAERFGTPTPEQHEILDRTLAYYRDNNWGWGEHMSDIYAPILQDEVLALYMWGPSLSPRQKQEVWDLFLEIVAIDDVFGSGPRVPTIRSYSATRSPSGGSHYRECLVPWDPKGSRDRHQPLRAMAYYNNIRALLPEKPEPSRHAEIDCYGGASAFVTWSDKWRLGAMSRYQIMDGIDHRTYGLSWQTMPVAYWRNGADWGFLQWESVVNGSSTRTHPQSYSSSFGGASKSLADSEPGMIGMTYSVRRDDGFVILRRCSRSNQWTSFKDRFRLIKSSTVPAPRKNGDWNIMDLDYDSDGKLQLQFFPLVGQGTQTLVKNEYNGYDWGYSYKLAGEEFAALWILIPGNSAPPAVDRKGEIVSLRWTDGDLRHLDVDLASSDPMKVMEVKESGLPVAVDYGAGATPTDHKFFHTAPALENNTVVLRYQQAYVDKLLSYSLKYPHVLYCMNNETGEPVAWSDFWARYVRAQAAEAGRQVEVAEMRRHHDITAPDHRHMVNHPDLYSFLDISQNNTQGGQTHWDRMMQVRAWVQDQPRPINNNKIYSGGNDEEAVARMFRIIFAGGASARFHRPHPLEGTGDHEQSTNWGLGLSPRAQATLRAARTLTEAMNVFACEPRNGLLGDRQPNEGYCLAEPGRQYAVYFPDGGAVRLNVSAAKGTLQVRWLDVSRSAWQGSHTVEGGGILELKTPGTGHWAVLVLAR